jgi:hypothetical protein
MPDISSHKIGSPHKKKGESKTMENQTTTFQLQVIVASSLSSYRDDRMIERLLCENYSDVMIHRYYFILNGYNN